MKTPNSHNSSEDTPKSSQSRSSKKSSKSRTRSTKLELSGSANGRSAGGAANGGGIASSTTNHTTALATTPTTPTTTGSVFDSALGNGNDNTAEANNSSRSHHKSYPGLEPRSVKIMWEQHDQSDVELSAEVCARVAEDASYRLWELINNIKTYARHSGGMVTYDLVNEVLRDADVPPCLGAMDSDWDRIDYDGSYYFYSDRIVELRDEYQKEVTIPMADGEDFHCTWPVEDKHLEALKKYIPSLLYVALYGDTDSLDTVLSEVSLSPIIASCYRVLLAKIIQIIAFKQSDEASARCWSLLRACASNPHVRDIDCREEYYHLAEILICQLLAPYESIKLQQQSSKVDGSSDPAQDVKVEGEEVKLEHEQQHQVDMKTEIVDLGQQQQESFDIASAIHPQAPEKMYKLQFDDKDSDDEAMDVDLHSQEMQTSPYFASPIDWKLVDDLCCTLGLLSAISGYFQNECLHHITRRLVRFFDGRDISTERDYNYISRAVRGLISLGEYAFREFIPFLYKIKVDDVPESVWNDFALSSVFLNGPDDIFLYEWLEFVCGADKMQPFMLYYAEYYEKFLSMRFLKRNQGTFKLNPKLGVRRLEWSTLAAAMCHGDDPNKALKPKPTLTEAFPELQLPNLHLNRAGTIRFKFAGCRPVIIKPKHRCNPQTTESSTKCGGVGATNGAEHNILIARRRLFKPLTNERRMTRLCSYYYIRI